MSKSPDTYQAVLGTLNLPLQFSYKPLTVPKRSTKVRTFGGVRIHSPPSADSQIDGDAVIPFTIEGCTRTQITAITVLFNLSAISLTTLIFSGYWGDTANVKFTKLDPPTVRGQVWSISGELQVV